MANEHDHSYKLLFSHQQMVRDLLLGFVREEWVQALDLDTLEKANGCYVTDELRERQDDVVWRVRWGDSWLYIYLLIEFQSTVDPHMAVRLMSYLGLLYQDLIRQKALTPGGKLPPVLPVVLYNGETRWRAADNIADLVEWMPGGLSRYKPSLQYLLLDEGAIVDQPGWPDETRNAVSALFRLEYHRSLDDMLAVLGRLSDWLKAPEQTGLRRTFAIWIKRVLLPSRLPGVDLSGMEPLHELSEMHSMLGERAKQWPQQWKEQGLEEGRREGRQEGRREGRAAILARQIERKFGELPSALQQRLEQASEAELEQWAERILFANSLEDVFH